MPRYDFHSPRLYVESPLAPAAEVALDRSQTHYLESVLRLKSRSSVLVFNGHDGEWGATLTLRKRAAALVVTDQVRAQTEPADLHYLFAPLKAARLDYMVQKAVEMGVSRLQPVFTQHTQVSRVNVERVRANAIEAAEQCGVLSLPEIAAPAALTHVIAERNSQRLLIFCDEASEVTNPVAALTGLARTPLAVLIGPEGGFATDERALLLKQPNVVCLSLGPRILRADTAAVAALAVVQAVIGDWR